MSRAAFKLESVCNKFNLDFTDKKVLDVGSSTGGFTDFALRHGAQKVIAVDKGTDQLHESLRFNSKVEVHEKTDILEFNIVTTPDVILIDVSFVSLKEILPAVHKIARKNTEVVAMAKPQFEAKPTYKNKGVIKNEQIRRLVLSDLEKWIKNLFVIVNKADSTITGLKGNVERFYLLKKS